MIKLVKSPLQRTWLVTGFTVGTGFTVIVKELDVPEQVLPALVKAGVTVIVAVTGLVPVLWAGKERICPVPLAGIPIEGSELVQLNCVPGTDPVKEILFTKVP